MKLSEATITHIINRADASWRHNQLPKSRKGNFLLTLKGYLREGGMLEKVCHHCLGSGFEPNPALMDDIKLK